MLPWRLPSIPAGWILGFSFLRGLGLLGFCLVQRVGVPWGSHSSCAIYLLLKAGVARLGCIAGGNFLLKNGIIGDLIPVDLFSKNISRLQVIRKRGVWGVVVTPAQPR